MGAGGADAAPQRIADGTNGSGNRRSSPARVARTVSGWLLPSHGRSTYGSYPGMTLMVPALAAFTSADVSSISGGCPPIMTTCPAHEACRKSAAPTAGVTVARKGGGGKQLVLFAARAARSTAGTQSSNS